MAIQVTDFVTKPALAYNRVHVSDLHITLEETQEAKTRVAIKYKLYGEDETGLKHFDRTLRTIGYDNFDQEIMAKAAEGDMTLAQARARSRRRWLQSWPTRGRTAQPRSSDGLRRHQGRDGWAELNSPRCIRCSAEGFRLTDGLCDGCHQAVLQEVTE